MLKKLPLYLGLLCWLLTGCAQLPATPLSVKHGLMPALAAEFTTTVIADTDHDSDPQPQSWRFWRGAQFVETFNLQDHSGDNWAKAADGIITYQRLFHDQQQLIDYLPGDLKAIGIEPDWQAITTLLDQAMLAPLLADGREEVLGYPAIHYQSTDKAHPLEVLWLEHEQLPAMIKYTEQGQTIITHLIALYPLAQSPWPYQRSANYRATDFADLGDKENDPFIKSIQHKIKGGHGHAH